MIRRNINASLDLVNGLEYLIERVSVKFEVIDRAYVIRKQFPLSLSYGITIYKSQGLSLQSAVMILVTLYLIVVKFTLHCRE
ncbi:hypothetical protein ACFW04_014310 [Cataglyphis niger]